MCYTGSMQLEVNSAEDMQVLGAKLGRSIAGGEVIELVGDIGAGKTTFVKGLASGLGIAEDVQSPTFTISRVYDSPRGIVLAHYDFYRLSEPGILRAELAESIYDQKTVTVIEWAGVVEDVMPPDTLRIHIHATTEDTRVVRVEAGGSRSKALLEVFL